MNLIKILDDSNSTIDKKTGEIVITVPILETDDKYFIDSDCKITSNCNTVIKCNVFKILSSPEVEISNINFEAAVFVSEINNFTMKNCTIKKSKEAEAALILQDCDNATISHVTITETEDLPGLYIFKNCVVMADHLLIHDIKEILLLCSNFSFLTITDSEFHNTESNGIFVKNNSYIDIQNCSLCNTKCPAIYVQKSQCIVKNNYFESVEQTSLSVEESKDFLIENNRFNKVKSTAVSALNESEGVIVNNTFTNVDGNGVYCSNSQVEIKDNNMTETVYPGIAVLKDSKVSIINNKISKVEYSGISVRAAKEVTIESSEIKEVKQSGVSVSDTEKCVIRKCAISQCGITAIESYNRSSVFASENTIVNAGKYAFIAFTSGTLNADHNHIDGVENAMARFAYKGGGEIVNNELANCPALCECQTTSKFYIARNGGFEGLTNDEERKGEHVTFDNSYRDSNAGLCVMCHVKPCDCFLLECGHKVYCKECAMKAKEAGGKCPLCRFPIDDISTGFNIGEDDTCIICFENKGDCMIQPCGHIGVCEKCLKSWLKEKNSCPICRTKNVTYKRIVM